MSVVLRLAQICLASALLLLAWDRQSSHFYWNSIFIDEYPRHFGSSHSTDFKIFSCRQRYPKSIASAELSISYWIPAALFFCFFGGLAYLIALGYRKRSSNGVCAEREFQTIGNGMIQAAARSCPVLSCLPVTPSVGRLGQRNDQRADADRLGFHA